MDFAISSGKPEQQRTECLVVPIFEPRKLTDTLKYLDQLTDGHISKIIRNGDIEGKLGQTLILHHLPKLLSTRVMLVGCGPDEILNDKAFNTAIKAMLTAFKSTSATTATCFITELIVKDRDDAWKIQQAVITAADVAYYFDTHKSNKTAGQLKLQKLEFTIATPSKSTKLKPAKIQQNIPDIHAALRTGITIANSMSYTKDLANTPANICTPTHLAEEATKLSKKHPQLQCDILDRKAMKKLGMGAILAVAQGSNEEPKLVVLKYNGVTKTKTKAHTAPIVIIGKGITFDTGGNSLKTPALMIGMKYDMAGAATVLGLMRFVAELNLPINVIGIMACAENMPGGTAIRPDDIITSMAGITIEVANTDAEGRLVLCDALTYSTRFKPRAVIDVATLTGACVVALGRHHSGLFSNDDSLAEELRSAGITAGDRCWQLPISEEYQCQLDSTHADVVNVGGPEAGSITGACFLARFATDLRWAHLDVAGTATSKEKVATGRPVPLLAQYLLNQLG